MVQFTLTLALSMAVLAVAVPSEPILERSNGNCKNGVLYCGHTLDNMGWNYQTIKNACYASSYNNGQVPDDGQIEQSLFKCGASGGALVWVNNRTPCARGCVDGGSGNSDYCE
ncbi:uncharacterized protein BDR25DRAFT_62501 [Lindgomyces ingoldianus]|uniref:Uncharacterized protein n=1 Tax=Lindgomyces ingoldianus TaxID=673940 RepID=A0ACB6QMP3_9PLEO|nr:uncharacterized protein BDR25DRAFT_62501 [Lindgomyces ingoldianus]KAF2467421.1 hypothetical protein BDR25DRAFT_62501 [Lindgomyces ingoldianus]